MKKKIIQFTMGLMSFFMFLPGVSATPLQAKASETNTQEVSAEREEGMEKAENRYRN